LVDHPGEQVLRRHLHGLNQNSYLWKSLPGQGALLKNYFGTRHFSQYNYESMVSGQGPQEDTKSDCGVENLDSTSGRPHVRQLTGLERGSGKPVSSFSVAPPRGSKTSLTLACDRGRVVKSQRKRGRGLTGGRVSATTLDVCRSSGLLRVELLPVELLDPTAGALNRRSRRTF
jgi:hypothetical protein